MAVSYGVTWQGVPGLIRIDNTGPNNAGVELSTIRYKDAVFDPSTPGAVSVSFSVIEESDWIVVNVFEGLAIVWNKDWAFSNSDSFGSDGARLVAGQTQLQLSVMQRSEEHTSELQSP